MNDKGETVWEINKNDLPGITLYTVQEVSRLANGNTLINNWSGSLPLSDWTTVVQLIEVTPDKKVVWALREWNILGPASSTQLLDEPGVPENVDSRDSGFLNCKDRTGFFLEGSFVLRAALYKKSKSHPRQWVDCSSPVYKATNHSLRKSHQRKLVDGSDPFYFTTILKYAELPIGQS